MKRITTTHPASKEVWGYTTMWIEYAVVGSEGAMAFIFSTGVRLDGTVTEPGPIPGGFHVHRKTDTGEPCHLVGHCVPDGSYLEGEKAFEVLRFKGSDALFEWLEQKYREEWPV